MFSTIPGKRYLNPNAGATKDISRNQRIPGICESKNCFLLNSKNLLETKIKIATIEIQIKKMLVT
jgi:hypothetical protein